MMSDEEDRIDELTTRVSETYEVPREIVKECLQEGMTEDQIDAMVDNILHRFCNRIVNYDGMPKIDVTRDSMIAEVLNEYEKIEKDILSGSYDCL